MNAIERDEISVEIGSLRRLLIGYAVAALSLNFLVVVFLFGFGQEVLVLALLNAGLGLALIHELPETYILSQEAIQERTVWGIKRIELSAVREIRAAWVPFGTSQIHVTDIYRNRIAVPILPMTLEFRRDLGKQITKVRPSLGFDSTTKKDLGMTNDQKPQDT